MTDSASASAGLARQDETRRVPLQLLRQVEPCKYDRVSCSSKKKNIRDTLFEGVTSLGVDACNRFDDHVTSHHGARPYLICAVKAHVGGRAGISLEAEVAPHYVFFRQHKVHRTCQRCYSTASYKISRGVRRGRQGGRPEGGFTRTYPPALPLSPLQLGLRIRLLRSGNPLRRSRWPSLRCALRRSANDRR